jgi:hypothetical protein
LPLLRSERAAGPSPTSLAATLLPSLVTTLTAAFLTYTTK